MDLSQQAHIELFRKKILRDIAPINTVVHHSQIQKDIFPLKRSEAGYDLPPYYLVYFLLVDLLDFLNLGPFDKTAWSVPIEYKGDIYAIEHKKFGLGLFTFPGNEQECEEIVKLITKGVNKAKTYFEYRASKAIAESKLNVKNNCKALFRRYQYFLHRFKQISKIYNAEKDSFYTTTKLRPPTYKTDDGFYSHQEMSWLSQAAIDAFFSWTEHLFIHIAVLYGRITTGEEVAKLAEDNWQKKFAIAIPITSKELKKTYDELLLIRNQVRNYVAHGSFGKNFETFNFHSGAGAVPITMFPDRNKHKFSIERYIPYEDVSAISVIEKFIELLWQDDRRPARMYLMDNDLPVVLTFAANGRYPNAMQSEQTMKALIEELNHIVDKATDMDY